MTLRMLVLAQLIQRSKNILGLHSLSLFSLVLSAPFCIKLLPRSSHRYQSNSRHTRMALGPFMLKEEGKERDALSICSSALRKAFTDLFGKCVYV